MTNLVWTGWAKRHLWPEADPEGFVFMAHAFHAIGNTLFEQWSGYEVEDAEKDAPERIPDANAAYIGDAPHWGFHQRYGPQLRALAPGLGELEPIPRDLWQVVTGDRQQQWVRVQEARFRRDMVVRQMWERARQGSLVFAARPKGGGAKPLVIPAEQWEIDYPWVPFATLGYDRVRGLASAQPTDWLFVTADSLERVLSPDSPAAIPDTAPGDSVSDGVPYGRLPPTAKPNNAKHEAEAHEAAAIVRTEKVSRSEAFRRVAKDDPTRDRDSVMRAIRAAYDLMYHSDGTPINN